MQPQDRKDIHESFLHPKCKRPFALADIELPGAGFGTFDKTCSWNLQPDAVNAGTGGDIKRFVICIAPRDITYDLWNFDCS